MSWQVVADAKAVAEAAAQKIQKAAEEAIARSGSFSLVLAGGSTPVSVYRLLAAQEADWPAWQFYFGDERCLPADDPERNSVMATQNLFEHIPVQDHQIHVILAENGAEAAAAAYANKISSVMPFDLVLLGLGEDGHTASLFPGQEHPEGQLVVPVHDAPKPPPDRVSLNYGALASATEILFLVSGKGKAEAVKQWRNGQDIPAARLSKLHEPEILIDTAAWHE
ncbi:MAG TPA: 6-phosphogluconolactonase [Halieaceae bacterium]|nr:6-phosphogluconolactonase [Halieaceae bacterium]